MAENSNVDALIKLVLYAITSYQKAGIMTKVEAIEALEECLQYVRRDTAEALYQFLQMQ